MELVVENEYGVAPQTIIMFLEFLLQNFNFMVECQLSIHEDYPALIYNEEEERFNMLVERFGIFNNYWNELNFYNENIKVDLSHRININTISKHKRPVNQYMMDLRNKLPEFEYASCKESGERNYEFEKYDDFGDEMQICTGIYFTHRRV